MKYIKTYYNLSETIKVESPCIIVNHVGWLDDGVIILDFPEQIYEIEPYYINGKRGFNVISVEDIATGAIYYDTIMCNGMIIPNDTEFIFRAQNMGNS